MEQTLVVIKPDAFERGEVGRIYSRFEISCMRIIQCRMLIPSRALASSHYGDLDVRYSPKVKEEVVTFLSSGYVMALVLEGTGVVELVRVMIGPTDPASAKPGTIRGDILCMSLERSRTLGVALPNLVHASATVEEAAREIALWFGGI